MKFEDTSNTGEASFLLDYFGRHEPKHKMIVDVGAYGKHQSNTWGLLALGWKGLLIEANPDRIPVIEKDFAGMDVRVRDVAVGMNNATVKLYIHSQVGSSSLLKDWHPATQTGTQLNVKMLEFKKVLAEEGVPHDFDILQVDAEGMDRTIIVNMFTGEWRPKIIVCESFSVQNDDGFLIDRGYRLVFQSERGRPWQMYGNRIYERMDG